MGCGIDGVLAYVGKEDEFYTSEAKAPRGVKSTVGAGDALFSSFIHFYHKGYEIQRCLDLATLFSGIKISCSGGSNGFVSEEELLESELHYNETY
jgi:ribokinase